ncbi:MAG TPA: glycosyltransferase family 4 protein [Verrucomicrobiae bacterium]|nr:glycosyltransferase family 4 protein [Verrucomicrobiae bacterium]
MRILIVNHRDWLNPRAGGVEEVLYQTATRWVAGGHGVRLLASDFVGSSARQLTVDGVAVTRCAREEVFNWVAPWYVRRWGGDVDVIVEHISKVAGMLPWYTRRPVVGYVHHLFGRTIFETMLWPVAAYVVAMEKVAMRVYRRCLFITVSESTAQDVVANGIPAANLRVVYNGVDLAHFRPGPAGSKTVQPSVLWVGRVRKTKCVTHVVDAFEIIARRLPAATLMIVGQGDFEGELRRIIASKNLQDRVTMTGYLDADRLRDEMQRAWVLAYPSPKEGWGLCVTEAAACGTPTVASNSPGLCESVRDGETGFLVRHGDIAGFAEKLLLLLTTDSLRQRMSAAAVKQANHLTWDETARRALDVLHEAVKRNP